MKNPTTFSRYYNKQPIPGPSLVEVPIKSPVLFYDKFKKGTNLLQIGVVEGRHQKYAVAGINWENEDVPDAKEYVGTILLRETKLNHIKHTFEEILLKITDALSVEVSGEIEWVSISSIPPTWNPKFTSPYTPK